MRCLLPFLALFFTIDAHLSAEDVDVASTHACPSQPSTSTSSAVSFIQLKAALKSRNTSANNRSHILHAAEEEAAVNLSSTSIHDGSHILGRMAKDLLLLESTVHKISRQNAQFLPSHIAGAVIVILLVLTGLANFIIKNVVGKIVEVFIRAAAPLILGVEVDFDDLNVSPLQGRVHIYGMNVCNPSADPPYTGNYLFHAKNVIVDVSVSRLVCSFGSNVIMEELVLDGVHLIFEKRHLLAGKSNVEEVREFMRGNKAKAKADEASAAVADIGADAAALTGTAGADAAAAVGDAAKDAKAAAGAVGAKAKDAANAIGSEAKSAAGAVEGEIGAVATVVGIGADPAKKSKKKESESQFIVKMLQIKNVGVEAKIGGGSTSLSLPPIVSEDLSKECDGTEMSDVILAIAEKLAASVLHCAVQGAMKGVKNAEKSLGKCCGKVCGS